MYKKIINDLLIDYQDNLQGDENKISMIKEDLVFSLFKTLKWKKNNSSQIHQYKHETNM